MTARDTFLFALNALSVPPALYDQFDAYEAEMKEGAEASAANLERVYVDRNLCVALLLRMCAANRWQVGTCQSPRPAPGFSRIALIETPEGQIGWHFPDADQPLFATLDEVFGEFSKEFDGHHHDEKFARMRTIISTIDRLNRDMLGIKQAEMQQAAAEAKGQPS